MNTGKLLAPDIQIKLTVSDVEGKDQQVFCLTVGDNVKAATVILDCLQAAASDIFSQLIAGDRLVEKLHNQVRKDVH